MAGKQRREAGEEEGRGGERRGAEAGRGRNNQTSVSGVWRATRVSNMEVGYWQAPPFHQPHTPDLYGAEVGETAGWSESFNF